ncbi:hypothetical protein HQ403_03010 [Candidatus Kaiserbacteria bacterium]|nr:hypothetical protein [Candidatus Kaiserbacteria bacterium]
MINERLDSLGTVIVLTLVFLLPIFFIPFISVSPQESKLLLLIAGVLIPVLLWTVARLKSNSITLPKEKFILPLITLPLIAFVSAFFSGNVAHSLVGQGVEVDTVLMILVLVLGFGVGTYLFNSKDKVIKFYLVLITSSLILFSYQLAKLFLGGDFLSFNNMFPSVTSNLLGKWNDMAVFAGLVTLLSLITLDTLRPRGLLKAVFYLSLIMALCILIIVNFSLVWFILGSILFLIFIRSFLANKFFAHKNGSTLAHPTEGTISGLVLLVLAITVLFILTGSTVERLISAQFGIAQIEARPSLQSTLTLTKEVYSDSILFGAGPNNFTKEWLLHKPTNINNTPFWDLDFQYGVGIIPTFFITHGVLSIIAWVLFFILFLWSGIRTFIRFDLKPFDNYLSTSSFLSASFLWVVSIMYVPHVTLFFFAFLFSGVFLAVQVQTGVVKQRVFTFSEDIKVGFLGIVLLFVLLIVSVTSLYVSAQKYTSSVYIGQASAKINIFSDTQGAEEDINRALLFSKGDLVYRATSEISLFRLTNLINQGENTSETQKQFQEILSKALGSGRSAVAVDDKNYQNWVTLGRAYEVLIPLNVESAYENARISYEQALSLSPRNPKLVLNIARTEVLNGNNDVARERIADALIMKNDYTDAIYLLSQIEIKEGKVSEAIDSIETASFLTPQDPLVFFQLGILKYSEHDYVGAISALERAVLLDNNYANARYFLGLSYYQSGRIEDSINQFNLVKDLNPGSVEVSTILSNIKAGRDPFNNLNPPTDQFEGFGPPLEE